MTDIVEDAEKRFTDLQAGRQREFEARQWRRIRRAITLYTQQVYIHGEKGACHPHTHRSMDRRLEQARSMLCRVIAEEMDRDPRDGLEPYHNQDGN